MPGIGGGSAEAIDAQLFFGLVDELLTPAMMRLGYHRIGGSVNDQPSSRGVLVSGGSGPIDQSLSVPFLWFDFGFEAGSGDVQRLVEPDDPDNADELWLSYEPATGTLELGDWEPIVVDRVDWDIWRDSGPCSSAEVRRRLGRLGGAVDEFNLRASG